MKPLNKRNIFGLHPDEVTGFARTIIQIEWLLAILVLLYQFVPDGGHESSLAITVSTGAFLAYTVLDTLVLSRWDSQWKLVLANILMIVYVTLVIWHTGRFDSPLLTLYLLPIITSAISLGTIAALLVTAAISAAFLFVGPLAPSASGFTLGQANELIVKLAPFWLVAYMTSLLRATTQNALEKVQTLSETDPLTKLLNMRSFYNIAEQELARCARYGQTFAILMIDVDGLKTVNDLHGHEAGNKLLATVASNLTMAVRTTDVVARYGGDEFAVLLLQVDSDRSEVVAKRIRRYIKSAQVVFGDQKIMPSVSIGVATYPVHGTSVTRIIDVADQALFASKQAGRDCYTIAEIPAAEPVAET
jgi:diguanylate cyclase (GGDEF)-like protein